MSDFSIFSKIRKILKKPPLRKKNSYGYDFAPRHDVRVFIHSSYISFEIKTATDLQRFYVWAPEFFLRGFSRFWHLAVYTEKQEENCKNQVRKVSFVEIFQIFFTHTYPNTRKQKNMIDIKLSKSTYLSILQIMHIVINPIHSCSTLAGHPQQV